MGWFFAMFPYLGVAQSVEQNLYAKVTAFYAFDGQTVESVNNRLVPPGKQLQFSSGVFRKAIAFDQELAYLELPSSETALFAGRSMAFWFRADSLPNRCHSLVDKTNGSDYVLNIFGDSTLNFEFHFDHQKSTQVRVGIVPQKWYHVAVVVDSQGIGCYLNRQLVEYLVTPPILQGNTVCIVGAGGSPYTPGYQFFGKIDELCYFDGLLSTEQMHWLMDNGLPLKSRFLNWNTFSKTTDEYERFLAKHPEFITNLEGWLRQNIPASDSAEALGRWWWAINHELQLRGIAPPAELLQVKANPIGAQTVAPPVATSNSLYGWLLLLGAVGAVGAGVWWWIKQKKPHVALNSDSGAKELANTLAMKEETLAQFAVQLVEKNRLLQQIGDHLKEIRETQEQPERAHLLNRLETRLKQATLNQKEHKQADDQAKAFNKQFAIQLRQKHPKLTPKDIRMIELLRAGMSSKEIASIINISPKSVDTSRHRLRKKLNLRAEEPLVEYLQTLSRAHKPQT
ncbi:MAG: LamG-like jellyroll fold domain-containing protein [Salibacteraceae bacterium]